MRDLLHNYFSGELTDEERGELFLRIDENDALKEEFVRLQNSWALSGMISKEEDEEWIVRKYGEIRRSIRRRKNRSFSLLKYGSVAVLFIGLWFLYGAVSLRKNANDFTYIEAPKGQRSHVILADGTEVWLNSRSRLKVYGHFNRKERIVELDGEGMFLVSENKEKPFTVKTKQYDIQVTGTKFNVFAYSASPIFETDLIEGSVTIYDPAEKNNRLHLLPNEKGFTEAGSLHKATYSFLESQRIQDGIYSFENKSLADLAKRLELWYDVKVNITQPQITGYTFSGKFRQTDNIDNILKAIKGTGKFDYKITGDQNIEIY